MTLDFDCIFSAYVYFPNRSWKLFHTVVYQGQIAFYKDAKHALMVSENCGVCLAVLRISHNQITVFYLYFN